MFKDYINFVFVVVDVDDDNDEEDLEFVNKFDAFQIKMKKQVKTKNL